MEARRNVRGRVIGLIFLLILVGFLVSTVSPGWARTGTYKVVILRAFYTDYPTSRYTDAQMDQAATEIHDYFATLSYGKLDVQVSVATATLNHSRAHYWNDCVTPAQGETRNPCPPPLIEDAAQAAAAGGFNFAGIHGIVLLSPWEDGNWTNGPVTISRPGVSGTFQRSYDHENGVEILNRLVLPPGPSGVYWNAWVHEIGHQLETIDGIRLGGTGTATLRVTAAVTISWIVVTLAARVHMIFPARLP